jgi:hypothetical protein
MASLGLVLEESTKSKGVDKLVAGDTGQAL